MHKNPQGIQENSQESTRSPRYTSPRSTVDLTMISVSPDDLRDNLQPLLIFCRSVQTEFNPQTQALLWTRFDFRDHEPGGLADRCSTC